MTVRDPARYRPDLGDIYPSDETDIERLRRFVDSTDVVISPPEWRKASKAVLGHLDRYQAISYPPLPKGFGQQNVNTVTVAAAIVAIVMGSVLALSHFYQVILVEAIVAAVLLVRLVVAVRRITILHKLTRELVDGIQDVMRTMK